MKILISNAKKPLLIENGKKYDFETIIGKKFEV